jgi:hypothetical protein
MDAIWKEIADFPGYLLSSDGILWSMKSGHELAQCGDKDGYKLVCLSNRTKTRTFRVNRLMAAVFDLPHPDGKYDIDHINADRGDNRLANLRCLSHRDNMLARKKTKKHCTSQYIGVSLYSGKWIAKLGRIYIGSFKTELEAAMARDRRALLDSPYRTMNFIE